jgi:hypothetical protein
MKLTKDLEGNVMLLCRPLVAGGSPIINKLTTLLLTAMLLAPLAALHAANFHVATTGNDSNPGTQTAPLNFE